MHWYPRYVPVDAQRARTVSEMNRLIGSALYRVTIRIRRLERAAWMAIRTVCAGRIGSLLEFRQGRLSDDIAEVVTDRGSGLFPQPDDIVASCECGDGIAMCQHAATVLSGIGSRLDESPELLFLLRGVDETELIAHARSGGRAGPLGRAAWPKVISGPSPAARTPRAVRPARQGPALGYRRSSDARWILRVVTSVPW